MSPGIRQRTWTAARTLEEFRVVDIARFLKVENGSIRDYIVGLERAGYLQIVKRGHNGITYAMKNDIGVDAPRITRNGTPVTTGVKHEQMWRVLRMWGGAITCAELAAHASTPATTVTLTDAAAYIQQLLIGGYVSKINVGKKLSINAQYQYRLTANTGPKPPLPVHVTVLFDPNTGHVALTSQVTEEDAIYGH